MREATDAVGVLEAICCLLSTGKTCMQRVDSVIDGMRDLLVIKSTNKKSGLLILTARGRKRMVELVAKFDMPALIYNITTLERLHWTIKNSDNPRALLEASMLRLALSEHFMGVDALLAQLKTSGGRGAPAGRGAVKKKRIERPVESKVETPVAESKPAAQTDAGQQAPADAGDGWGCGGRGWPRAWPWATWFGAFSAVGGLGTRR